MSKPVTNFYDRLSPEYRHNMGWDWDAVMRNEGKTLNRLIAEISGRSERSTLLDCSCGIGTQAIGLALQGYRVTATDLSPVSIECARDEAEKLGVEISFGVANFFELEKTLSDTFDVVLTCDNSIAHCLSDENLTSALSSMKAKLNPGGLLLISMRDYAPLVVEKPRFNNQHVQEKEDGRRVVFQMWDWAESGDRYHNNQFLLRQTADGYDTKHYQTELRAILKDEILSAVEAAGFDEVQWHNPDESDYYQPVITAKNS